nr:hypothetical protein [Phytoactinopolyspora limicola]
MALELGHQDRRQRNSAEARRRLRRTRDELARIKLRELARHPDARR